MANKLSSDQVNVLNDFKRYLEDASNYMVVSGAAGTGKTTLIQELQTLHMIIHGNVFLLEYGVEVQVQLFK